MVENGVSFRYSRWLTPTLLSSLKLYQLTLGRLPHFSIQIVLSEAQVPVLVEPNHKSGVYIYLTLAAIVCSLLILSLLKRLFVPVENFIWNDSLQVLRIAIAIICLIYTGEFCIVGRTLFLVSGSFISNEMNYFYCLNPGFVGHQRILSDIAGSLLLCYTMANIVFGLPLGIFLWKYELDPFTFLNNE